MVYEQNIIQSEISANLKYTENRKSKQLKNVM